MFPASTPTPQASRIRVSSDSPPPVTSRSAGAMCPSGRSRSGSEAAGSFTPGSPTAMPAAATRPTLATAHRVSCQSARPISVPRGSPSAVASVGPPSTKARARPRRSGGTMATAVLEATALMTPAPTAVRTRAASTIP